MRILILTDRDRRSFRVMEDLYAAAFRQLGHGVCTLPTPVTTEERSKIAADWSGCIVCHNTLGEGFQRIDGCINVAWPIHEWSAFPRDWIRGLDGYDDVWVSTVHVEEVLRSSGLTARMGRCPPPVVTGFLAEAVAAPEGGPFRLLAVGEPHFRKGHHLLMEGFRLAFPEAGQVELTIKTRSGCDWRSPCLGLHFLHVDMDAQELRNLYRAHHAYVTASLAEGLGLTVVEATCHGLPVAANLWGGRADLLDAASCIPISHEVVDQPFCSRPEYYAPGQQCAFSSPAAIARALRELVALKPERRAEQVRLAQSRQVAGFGRDACLERIAARLAALA